jgi:integrase
MGPIPRTGSATSGQTPTRLLAVMAADVVDYTRLTEAAELETHVRLRALRVGIMIGARAGMPFAVYPHMLRHGCGYALANAGHDTRALQAWLGHKNIQHTVRYTELRSDRFDGFWKD